MSDKEDFFDELKRYADEYNCYQYMFPENKNEFEKKGKYKRPSFSQRLEARAKYYENRTEEQKLQDQENLRKAIRFVIFSVVISAALSIIYYVFFD